MNTPLISDVKKVTTQTLTLNVPEWYKNGVFLAWLNADETNAMTWHQKGEDATEFSDICVWLEPCLNGEGTDSDMPEIFMDAIIKKCRQHIGKDSSYTSSQILVRLTNLA